MFSRFVALVLMTLSFSACLDGGGGSNKTSNLIGQATPIDGSYKMDCYTSGGNSTQSSYELYNGNYTHTISSFTNPTCAGSPSNSIVNGLGSYEVSLISGSLYSFHVVCEDQQLGHVDNTSDVLLSSTTLTFNPASGSPQVMTKQ